MGRSAPRSLTLDTGALIAFEERGRQIAVLIQRARDVGLPIIIPAGVLAQTWRNGRRQARLAALLSAEKVRVEDLTAVRARAIGELCGRANSSDIVDASVVLAARQHDGVVATSDPVDILHIDPTLAVVKV